MRLFEILLILLLVWQAWTVIYAGKGHRRRGGVTLLILLALLGAHWFFEGWRWQMLPVYFFIALAVLGTLYRLTQKRFYLVRAATGVNVKLRRVSWSVAVFSLIALAALPPFLFPVFRLPAPSGKFLVGVSWLKVVDLERTNAIYGAPQEPRALYLTLWYPRSDDSTGMPNLPFASDPPWYLNHLRLIDTGAVANAGLADTLELLPLIVFSHEIGSVSSQNTQLFMEFASRGYLVVSIAHPYEALYAGMPKGERTGFAQTWAMVVSESLANVPLKKLRAVKGAVKKKKLLSGYWGKQTELAKSFKMRTNDIWFVFDELEKLQKGSISSLFTQKLDLSKIILMGHGLGGSASLEACEGDQRCMGSFLIDAMPLGAVLKTAPIKPVLALHQPSLNPLYDLALNTAEQGVSVSLEEVRHFDFTDLRLAVPDIALGSLLGTTSGKLTQKVELSFAGEFADYLVWQKPTPLFFLQGQEGLRISRYGQWDNNLSQNDLKGEKPTPVGP